MFRNFILLNVIFLGLMACESIDPKKENEGLIWLDVYSRYLAADQAYKAEFTFLKGDTLPAATTFKLDGEVMFDERPMELRELSADFTRYQLDYNAPFRALLPILVKDEELKFKAFALNFPTVPKFELQNGEAARIVLNEPIDLKQLEALTAIISDENKQTASIEMVGPEIIKEITLGPDIFQQLSTGQWTIYLVYKRKGALLDKSKTINYLLEYYSDSQQISISELSMR